MEKLPVHEVLINTSPVVLIEKITPDNFTQIN